MFFGDFFYWFGFWILFLFPRIINIWYEIRRLYLFWGYCITYGKWIYLLASELPMSLNFISLLNKKKLGLFWMKYSNIEMYSNIDLSNYLIYQFCKKFRQWIQWCKTQKHCKVIWYWNIIRVLIEVGQLTFLEDFFWFCVFITFMGVSKYLDFSYSKSSRIKRPCLLFVSR